MEIDVINRSASGDITSFVPNTEFYVTELHVERHVLYYGCCTEPYPDVTFYLHLKRKPLFYTFNLLFPCILITTISLLGFLLPPDSGEKISLEITVLLSLAVFLLVVSENLPPTSESFPYIGVYFACAMLLVSLSTVLTVVVLNVHHKEYKPLPQWMRTLFLHHLSHVVLFSSDTNGRWRSFSRIQHFSGEDPINTNSVLQKQNDVKMIRGFEEDRSQKTTPLRNHATSQIAQGDASGKEAIYNTNPIHQLLKEQLEIQRRAEVRKDNKLRHEMQNNDWRHVALVLDRLFLIIFLVVVCVTSLAVLLPLANVK